MHLVTQFHLAKIECKRHYRHADPNGRKRGETPFYKHIVPTGLGNEGYCLEGYRCGWETAPTSIAKRRG